MAGKLHAKSHRFKTREEIDGRIDLMVKYIRENPFATKGDLHKKFCRKFDLHWRSIDDYTARARTIIRKQANVKPEDGRAVGLGVLFNLLNDKNHGIRVKAERSMASIMGYDSPVQHRIGSPDGSPLPSSNIVVAPVVQFIVGEPKKAMEDVVEVDGNGNGNGHVKQIKESSE